MLTKSGYLHLRSYKGHEDVINCFVYNDEKIITGSNDHTIRIFSLEKGSQIAKLGTTPREDKEQLKQKQSLANLLDGSRAAQKKPEAKSKSHSQGICCLALHGAYLYSGSFDALILQWDLKNNTCVREFKGHAEAVYRIVRLDRFLVSASRDKTVKLWNTEGKLETTFAGHTGPIRAMATAEAASGLIIYTGSDDCTIRQWQLLSSSQVRTYEGHTDGVTDLMYFSNCIFSSSFDCTVRQWDVDSNQCLRACKAGAGLRGLYIAAGKIFGAGNNAALYVWDLNSKSPEPLASDRFARGGLTMVAVEGHRVFASSADNICRLWEKVSSQNSNNRSDFQAIASSGEKGFFPPGMGSYVGQMGDDLDLDLDPLSPSAVGKEAAPRNFEEDDASKPEAFLNKFMEHKDKVHTVATHDGLLFSGSSDNTAIIRPINPRDKRETKVLEGHSDRILALLVAGNGDLLFTASADTSIKKWEVATGACLGTLGSDASGHSDWVSCLAEGEGSLFSGSWDSYIRKWDISTNRHIADLTGHQDPVYCLASAPGVLFSGSRDCTVIAWNTETCHRIREYEGAVSVVSSILVADPLLFASSWDKHIRCWNLKTGGQEPEYPRQSQAVLSILLEKGVLYAAGNDKSIRCLSQQEKQEEACYLAHTQAVNALCTDGDSLFSASDDGTIIQWKLHNKEDLAADSAADPTLSKPLAIRIQESAQAKGAKGKGPRAQGSLPHKLNTELQFLTHADIEDPLDKMISGFLYKQGALFKRWSRRYFTLHKGVLMYFSNEHKKKPLDFISMHHLLAVAVEEKGSGKKEFSFSITTVDGVRYLAAETEQELEKWMRALEQYMHNNDLQKKIDQKREARKY